jgi:hypothetical protein
MSKISALDEVQNPDGNETAVVLKNGKAMRASIAKIMAPALAALQDRVFAPKFTAFALSRTLVELGDANPVTLTWAVSDAPTTQKLNGATIGAGDRSATLAAPNGAWTANNANQTVALYNASNTITDTRSLAVMARIPIFIGMSAAIVPDDATLLGAAYKALDSDRIARTLSLARGSGGYPFILYPAALTLSTVKLGGFAVTGWSTINRGITLKTGAGVGMKLTVLDAIPASNAPLTVELA